MAGPPSASTFLGTHDGPGLAGGMAVAWADLQSAPYSVLYVHLCVIVCDCAYFSVCRYVLCVFICWCAYIYVCVCMLVCVYVVPTQGRASSLSALQGAASSCWRGASWTPATG